MTISDIDNARDDLRQNEFELTAVGGEEKKRSSPSSRSGVRANVRFSEEATFEREKLALDSDLIRVIQDQEGWTLVRWATRSPSLVVILKALKKLKQPIGS